MTYVSGSPLYAKGKATCVYLTRTTNRTDKVIVATTTTQLRIKTIVLLRMDLKYKPGVVAYTTSQ